MSKGIALLSVSDKTGILPFARGLAELGYRILSTGGTLKHLQENNVPAESVSNYTGFPEIMDGRVKTLHPKIHGGILSRRDNPEDLKAMEANGIQPVHIVAVNLYPFAQTIAKENVTLEEAIENIDIGGPSMLRAAAKNHAFVTVVVDPADYPVILEQLKKDGKTSDSLRQKLAVKTFSHTATYDATIDGFLSRTVTDNPSLRLHFTSGQPLRYGENSHQSAEFYLEPESVTGGEAGLGNAKQLHGKALSYNNLADADAALEAVKECRDQPAVSIIKHMNPCGYATGATLHQAFEAAWDGDPVSAFGSIIACTRKVDLATAQRLKGRFVELLIAPGYDADALEFLKNKSKDLRILEIDDFKEMLSRKVYKHILGGILVQDRDNVLAEKWECVTEKAFPKEKEALARFTWKACKHTKSNAIVMGHEYAPGCFQVIGLGPGQPNRIDSNLRLCQPRVRDNAKRMAEAQGKDPEAFTQEIFSGLVMASDAFFPFDDNVRAAHEAGIRYIVQPGGSMRDGEVIQTCNELGIAMIFTGMRHFRH